MGYVHKEICQSFYYSPERWRDTPCSKTATLPLHALTVSLPIQYNTILSHFTMLSFIGEIQWENSRVNPIPWVRNTVGRHTSQIFFSRAPPPNPYFLGGAAPEPPWLEGAIPECPWLEGIAPEPQGRGNECTVLLGYNHNWIISLDLQE